ncbi:hypothetical protein SHM7688_02393 [Shimia marina]|uniref:Uncharacterized protein n=1 Tax=Shimia marina TaxID=321267 RepID=A0A0P1ER63_9RHOB|nr:hypothetical protein SHM7688_02393 [Shimia marina]
MCFGLMADVAAREGGLSVPNQELLCGTEGLCGL